MALAKRRDKKAEGIAAAVERRQARLTLVPPPPTDLGIEQARALGASLLRRDKRKKETARLVALRLGVSLEAAQKAISVVSEAYLQASRNVEPEVQFELAEAMEWLTTGWR